MKKVIIYTLALALSLILISCSDNNSVVESSSAETENVNLNKAKAGPSANGQGTITLEDGTTRHFSFHANTNKDGSVSGNGVLTYTKGVRKIMFDINCLSVSEEGTATLSGIITKDKQVEENVGNIIWFKVIDNGEGNNADADQITLMITNSVIECDSDLAYDLELLDVEGGNIQLKN